MRVARTRSLRDQRIEVSNGQKQATENGKMLETRSERLPTVDHQQLAGRHPRAGR